MKIDDKIRDEKIECDINREAAKILPLSSGKIDKYEFFTGKQILPYYRKKLRLRIPLLVQHLKNK